MEYLFLIIAAALLIVVCYLVVEGNKQQDELKTTKSDLKAVRKELKTAEKELNTAENRLNTAENRLETTEKELETTEKELQTTEKELQTTENELKDTKKDKDDALKAFYITHVTLKASVSVLFSKQYRYKKLRETSDETINSYKDLSSSVKTKADRRLARKAGTAALSLVPGLGLIDLLGDFVEIVGDVDDSANIIADMSTRIKELPIETENIECHFDPDAIDAGISSDGLMEDAHNTLAASFDEAFEEDIANLAPDAALTAEKLDTFTTHTIQNVGCLGILESENVDEQKKWIEDILRKARRLAEDATDQYRRQQQDSDEKEATTEDKEESN